MTESVKHTPSSYRNSHNVNNNSDFRSRKRKWGQHPDSDGSHVPSLILGRKSRTFPNCLCIVMTFPAPLPFAPMMFPMVATETSWLDHHADLIENLTPASYGFMSLFDNFRCPLVMFPSSAPTSSTSPEGIELRALKGAGGQGYLSGLAAQISAVVGKLPEPDRDESVEKMEDIDELIRLLELGDDVTWYVAGESSKKVQSAFLAIPLKI